MTASPFESLYCSVQGAPRRAKGKTSSAKHYEVNPFSLLFFLWRKGRDSFSRWRLGRLICVWLLFAVANHCLCLMIIFENRFSAIISQNQQSSIATAPLRSPLDCCDRSNQLCLMECSDKSPFRKGDLGGCRIYTPTKKDDSKVVFFSWATRIRTWNDRTRICSVTITP